MKAINLLFFCIVITFFGCTDELSELELNPLEDESISLLEISDYDYNEAIGRLEVNYELNYDFTLNKGIEGIIIIKDDLNHLLITDPTRSSFVERNLPINGTVCYRLAFLSEAVRVRETENICIDL